MQDHYLSDADDDVESVEERENTGPYLTIIDGL